MAKGNFFISYRDLQTESVVQLENLEIHSLTTFDLDKRVLKTPKNIGYYRQPKMCDYPIDLGKGLQDMTFSATDPEHYRKQKTFHHMIMQKQRPEFDICTTRGALRQIKFDCNEDLVAIKFENCIYLNILSDEPESLPSNAYQLKLRKHLFVDAPGEIPHLEEPVDQRKQIYATFSATLGKLRLFYSAEMVGVDNTELLRDLDNENVLKQLRFSMVKIFANKNGNWRQNYRLPNWLFQAHFAGISLLRLAHFNNKYIVDRPIETFKIADLLKEHENQFQARLQLLHNFLCEMRDLMDSEDCPFTAYVFNITNNCVRYERYVGPNKYSYLDEEYIDFIIDQNQS